MNHRYLWAPVALLFAAGSIAGVAQTASRLADLPTDTVLRVRLDDTIGSDRSHRGDRFTATVQDPSLPAGTHVQGVVIDATRADRQTPGRLGVDFQTLELPDGRKISIQGSPTALDSNSVQTGDNGRMVAKSHNKANIGKYIGYGAAGGLLIGSLLGKNVVGGLLGAGAGYLLGKNKDKKAENRDVVLKDGTELGVRLDQPVALTRS